MSDTCHYVKSKWLSMLDNSHSNVLGLLWEILSLLRLVNSLIFDISLHFYSFIAHQAHVYIALMLDFNLGFIFIAVN